MSSRRHIGNFFRVTKVPTGVKKRQFFRVDCNLISLFRVLYDQQLDGHFLDGSKSNFF